MVRSVVIAALVALAGCGGDDANGVAPCTSDPCACDTCGPSCLGDACAPGDSFETGEAVGSGVSSGLVMPDGRLAITTWDPTRGALVVILQRAGESTKVVHTLSAPGPSELGRWARIALEAGGGLQVAWFDAAAGTLLWARGDVAGFTAPTPVITANVGQVALAVDGTDHPHIAFRDDDTRTVRYATRFAAEWKVITIDGCAGEADCPGDDEDAGLGLDIVLVTGADSSTLPRIAFYDALRGDLKLAGRDAGGAWSTVTLDGRAGDVDSGDVGRFVSLALTPTRSLGVAYYDATLGALRYLGPTGATRLVDSGAFEVDDGRARRLNVGPFCTLDYDFQGSAHIIYVDSSTPGLRHARIPGDGAAVITGLAIPAGAWPYFAVVANRLVGAYGAFVTGLAPEATLRLFDLPAGPP